MDDLECHSKRFSRLNLGIKTKHDEHSYSYRIWAFPNIIIMCRNGLQIFPMGSLLTNHPCLLSMGGTRNDHPSFFFFLLPWIAISYTFFFFWYNLLHSANPKFVQEKVITIKQSASSYLHARGHRYYWNWFL